MIIKLFPKLISHHQQPLIYVISSYCEDYRGLSVLGYSSDAAWRPCGRRPAHYVGLIVNLQKHNESWFQVIIHKCKHAYEYYNLFLLIDASKS